MWIHVNSRVRLSYSDCKKLWLYMGEPGTSPASLRLINDHNRVHRMIIPYLRAAASDTQTAASHLHLAGLIHFVYAPIDLIAQNFLSQATSDATLSANNRVHLE